jgi:hypothetical protein
LDRNPQELGDLRGEYAGADLHQRRAILQEWAEWNSLELARTTFAQIAPRFTSEAARWQWEEGFGSRLGARTFAAYYQRFGQGHRAAVERGRWGGTQEQD